MSTVFLTVFYFYRAAFTSLLNHQVAFRNQVSSHQNVVAQHMNVVAQHINLQKRHTQAMLGVLQGMLAQQQQHGLFMQRLLLQQHEQLNGGGVPAPGGGGGGGGAPDAPDAPDAPVGGDGDGLVDAAGDVAAAEEQEQNNNNQTGLLNEDDDGMDMGMDAGVVARVEVVAVTAPTRRTVTNSLQPRGVSLVSIRGCPDSFRHLMQQWQIQRLGLYISPGARRSFSKNEKNAWTKWSRLYNLLLEGAGFPAPMRPGVRIFPEGIEPAESSRLMLEAAEFLDSVRIANGQNMNKYYQTLLSGLTVGRRRRQREVPVE
jgi:hypothetical protein